MRTKISLKVLLMIATLLSAAGFSSALAQEGDQSKAIKAEEFIANRPARPRPTSRKKVVRTPTSLYKASSLAPATPPKGTEFAQVGVTTWRFRPATSRDKTKELIEEDGNETATEWALERISDGTTLQTGQRVRLAIESLSRSGYLYVIDREQYADGTFGDARLIFPTRRTRDGNNEVKAGQLIYIPPPPRYFRVKPGQSEKLPVAETLTLLVSSQPLIDPAKLEDKAMLLTREQIEGWEKQWGMQPTKFELAGGAGRTMTDKEQSAGKDDTELNQDDPVPQTIYRVAIKPEAPLLVSVKLPYGYASSKQ
ncbi:MAG: hypothetical protein ABI596_07520 [Pyrinomonadaceae bacterium]